MSKVSEPRLAFRRRSLLQRQSPRGMALVLVMWVIALLTVMALALTQLQRTEHALTANQLDSARFRAQANAVLNLVALNLMTTPAVTFEEEALVLVPDGQPREMVFDDARLILTLSNEGSKLDLNAINREQLTTLIEFAQGPESQDELLRDQIADAILDWRDENDLNLLNGAEDADYAAAGLPFGAADQPFRSLEELRQVLGMSTTLYAGLAPHLKVEQTGVSPLNVFAAGQTPGGGASGVNETFAAAPVLAALHGYSLEDAERLVEERSQGLFADDDQPEQVPLDRGGPLYHLRIRQQTLSGPGRSMEAMIRVDSALEVLWRRFGSAPVGQDANTADTTAGI
ncbi:MAG: general secretion pathway protein GspK [Halochromatium sp.]|nr:general secretion pathway protein GspK [Halochromatium sp.]